MSSERQRVSDLAVWVGGQIKGLRTYVDQAIAAAGRQWKADLVGTATEALDTLGEVQTALAADKTALAGLLDGLAKRVRIDTAQGLNAQEQATARANIGAVSQSDLGEEVDYVAIAVKAAT